MTVFAANPVASPSQLLTGAALSQKVSYGFTKILSIRAILVRSVAEDTVGIIHRRAKVRPVGPWIIQMIILHL